MASLPIVPTTRRERMAWYLYDASTHSFVQCVLLILAPVVQLDLAQQAATDANGQPCAQSGSRDICLVGFLGARIAPVSYALYISAISVICQVVCFVTLSPLADYSTNRHRMLSFFTCLLVLAELAFPFIGFFNEKSYLAAGALVIIANIAYGCAIVCYNAYLPLLIAADPNVLEPPPDADIKQLSDAVGHHISTRGFMAAYAGGLIMLILVAGSLVLTGNQTIMSLELAIASCGIITLISYYSTTYRWLLTRPGPDMPVGESPFQMMLYSWKKTIATMRYASRLPNTFLFLLSWAFLSDGYFTIASVALLMCRTELHMSTTDLFILVMIPSTVGIPGVYGFFRLHRWLKITTKQMLIVLIVLMLLLPIWISIGLINGVPFGAKSVNEMFVLVVCYGILVAALGSFSRVAFAELIPLSMESEMFGLFQITDRGSSWLGPILCGLVTQSFGSARYAFLVLTVLLLISIPILHCIDDAEGRKHAAAFQMPDTREPSILFGDTV